MDVQVNDVVDILFNTLHAEIISTSPFTNAEIKIISWRSK